MKTKTLLFVIALLLSIVNVSASNTKTKIYSNKVDNIKECIIFDNKTPKALRKIVYNYDPNGIIQERSLYMWDNTQGWVGLHKCSYIHNNKNKLVKVIYTKWDKKLVAWATTSQHPIYTYDVNGKLLAIEKEEVKNNLMATH